jgi:hypothetical protein
MMRTSALGLLRRPSAKRSSMGSHVHARALGGLFHLALLLFHVLRPDVGAQRAHAGADDGTRAGPAACDRTQHGTGRSAHTGARGRAALGVAHVRAARDEQCGRGGGGQDDVLAHGKLLLNRWERAVR